MSGPLTSCLTGPLTSPLTGTLAGPIAGLDPDREEARRWAAEELARREYQQARPGLLERALNWLWDSVTELLSQAPAGEAPWALVVGVLAAAVLLVVGYAIWRAGGVGSVRTGAGGEGIFGAEAELTAEQHRQSAERAEAAGDWETAVIERFRAVVRQLEERTLLPARPGRTAGEVAGEIATTLPSAHDAVQRAAMIFDAVRYGGRAASRESAEQLRAADELVRGARAVLA